MSLSVTPACALDDLVYRQMQHKFENLTEWQPSREFPIHVLLEVLIRRGYHDAPQVCGRPQHHRSTLPPIDSCFVNIDLLSAHCPPWCTFSRRPQSPHRHRQVLGVEVASKIIYPFSAPHPLPGTCTAYRSKRTTAISREKMENRRGGQGEEHLWNAVGWNALNSLGFHKGLPALQSGSHRSPRVVPVWLIGASL